MFHEDQNRGLGAGLLRGGLGRIFLSCAQFQVCQSRTITYHLVRYMLTKRNLIAQRQRNSLCLASYAHMPLNRACIRHLLYAKICKRIFSKYAPRV